ncbi:MULTISPECIES: group I truncated hemoglobin [Saliphagus]|uniref:Group 1 truncated hemoglobin n=1 Tax=Saliphagus infecundisoli TaxID=1849069 RepID=A0ABD5Q9P4_9EURY|nr:MULTISPECIES: group 1 truncated hemoglobin [Saliphagus]
MTDETLYERLGGRESIATVVDSFYEKVLDDERVAGYFDGIDMERQRIHQTQFLSAVTGGPVEYTGDEMASAHDHLDIAPEEFEAIATHLDRTLAEFEVSEDDREAVMDAVYGYEEAIVTAR